MQSFNCKKSIYNDACIYDILKSLDNVCCCRQYRVLLIDVFFGASSYLGVHGFQQGQ